MYCTCCSAAGCTPHQGLAHGSRRRCLKALLPWLTYASSPTPCPPAAVGCEAPELASIVPPESAAGRKEAHTLHTANCDMAGSPLHPLSECGSAVFGGSAPGCHQCWCRWQVFDPALKVCHSYSLEQRMSSATGSCVLMDSISTPFSQFKCCQSAVVTTSGNGCWHCSLFAGGCPTSGMSCWS